MTTPQRRPRRTRAESGEEVLRHLLEVAPDRLTRAALLERMEPDYSPSQVATGTLWVKEVGASREGRPFTSSRKNGAGFPDDPQEWTEYELGQGKRVYNMLDRVLKSTIDPHLQQRPDDPIVRRLHEHFSTAVREVGIGLEELKHPPATPAGV
ncbi:hypothetical protein [Sphaerisporangium fuscum]|uniref:hypothetical protein n=1 Tax=Sphaerisporangium fuscum TaxID=2835868 RepID=UPI001BDC9C09|nr:hypothetical protein [Sphaerisporangium fuscum]